MHVRKASGPNGYLDISSEGPHVLVRAVGQLETIEVSKELTAALDRPDVLITLDLRETTTIRPSLRTAIKAVTSPFQNNIRSLTVIGGPSYVRIMVLSLRQVGIEAHIVESTTDLDLPRGLVAQLA